MKQLLFIFILWMGCIGQMTAQDQPGVVININKNDDFSNFNYLEEDLSKYNLFFTGENHLYHHSNVKLELKMFRYLHENADVDYLLIEFGSGAAWMINQFLETGDSTYIKALNYYPFSVYKDLFYGLSDYYKTLPDSNKFEVVGLDREGNAFIAVEALVAMMPEDPHAPDSIMLHTDALRVMRGRVRQERDNNKQTSGIPRRKFNTLRYFIENYKEHKSYYETYLGDNAEAFEKAVNSLNVELSIQEFESYDADQSVAIREQFMYSELLKLYERDSTAKGFGQFGRCHVTRLANEDLDCRFYGLYSLNKRIQTSKHPQLKDKVLSIGILYEEMVRSNSYPDENYQDHSRILNQYEDDAFTLVRLADADTSLAPLREQFDYLVVNRAKEDTLPLFAAYDEETYVELPTNVMLNGLWGYHWFELTDVNTSIFGIEDVFEEQALFWGLDFTVMENQAGSIGYMFRKLYTQEVTVSNTTRYKLNGFFISNSFGYEATKSENFNIHSSLGYGYGRLKIAEYELNTTTTPLGTSTKSEVLRKYKNHAWFVDGRLEFIINLRGFNVGVMGGYLYDFSNPEWKLKGTTLEDGIETKLSGPYAAIRAGFNFR